MGICGLQLIAIFALIILTLVAVVVGILLELYPISQTDSDLEREKNYDRLSVETMSQFDAPQLHYVHANDTDSLCLVLFAHRHGDRFPQKSDLRPSDPLFNQSFWRVFGLENLTTRGRLRSFKLGHLMSARYGKFLAMKALRREQFVARSSAFAGCVESGELFRAGLLNPAHNSILSNPVEYSKDPLAHLYTPGSTKIVSLQLDGMIGDAPKCNRYDEEYSKLGLMKQENDKDLQELAEQVRELLGFNVISVNDWYSVMSVVSIEATYFPDLIQEKLIELLPQFEKANQIAEKIYVDGNPIIKRLNAGLLAGDLEREVDQFVELSKKEGLNSSNLTRFVQYSTHDNRILGFLAALNVTDYTQFGYQPGYSANVALELHLDPTSLQFYAKVFYMPEVPGETFDLTPQVCLAKRCTLEKLKQVMAPVSIPTWYQFEVECNNKLDQLNPFEI